MLIAGEMATTPELSYNGEFWLDTVLTYCMLRRNGFADDDIYVLYGAGEDPVFEWNEEVQSTEGELPPFAYYTSRGYCGDIEAEIPDGITDIPMVPTTASAESAEVGCDPDGETAGSCYPRAILECLAGGCQDPEQELGVGGWQGGDIKALTEADYLFVWWKGHGDSTVDAQQQGQNSDRAYEDFELRVGFDELPAADLISWIDQVPAGRRLLVFETCQSGCLENAWSNSSSTILLSSCQCDQPSLADDVQYDAWHGVFSFWIAGTLGGRLPPHCNNPMDFGGGDTHDVTVQLGQSVSDAFTETEQATVWELGTVANTNLPRQQPLSTSSGTLAADTSLDQEKPGVPPSPS